MRWARVALAIFVLAGTAAVVLPGTAGAAVPAAAVSTSTTLTASSTSLTQDSWVTLTAQVNASSGTPAGSVTFTDVSNGSVLDTASLSGGTAAFTTAALAPGTRNIVATYSGSSTFTASSSAAVGISVTVAGSLAVAFQVDARHDGRQPVGALSTGSLVKKWSRAMPGAAPDQNSVSYPVIAHGRVFVTVQATGTHLYALNASTGATDWSVNLGGSLGYGTPAYDGRRVFAVNYDGVLTAFVASTGHELWTTDFSVSVTAPPTAYDGVLYISGDAGEVYAVSEADGRLLWLGPVLNGGGSSPAVDSTGAYVSYSSQQDYRFSIGGQLVWHYAGCCEGPGGSAPVLHGSYVYARGDFDPPLIIAKSTGAVTGTFASVAAPAFDSTKMYTLEGGNLVAVAPSGSPNRWTFKNGSFVTAPVVNNGVVYIGSSSGKVYGVSASSGAKVWSGTAGTSIVGPGEGIGIQSGITIGGGLLVVPAANVLTALGD